MIIEVQCSGCGKPLKTIKRKESVYYHPRCYKQRLDELFGKEVKREHKRKTVA